MSSVITELFITFRIWTPLTEIFIPSTCFLLEGETELAIEDWMGNHYRFPLSSAIGHLDPQDRSKVRFRLINENRERFPNTPELIERLSRIRSVTCRLDQTHTAAGKEWHIDTVKEITLVIDSTTSPDNILDAKSTRWEIQPTEKRTRILGHLKGDVCEGCRIFEQRAMIAHIKPIFRGTADSLYLTGTLTLFDRKGNSLDVRIGPHPVQQDGDRIRLADSCYMSNETYRWKDLAVFLSDLDRAQWEGQGLSQCSYLESIRFRIVTSAEWEPIQDTETVHWVKSDRNRSCTISKLPCTILKKGETL